MISSNGVKLAVGMDVAYNLSGTVTAGIIIRLIPEARGHSATRVWIATTTGFGEGGISKVRDPSTILALETNKGV